MFQLKDQMLTDEDFSWKIRHYQIKFQLINQIKVSAEQSDTIRQMFQLNSQILPGESFT